MEKSTAGISVPAVLFFTVLAAVGLLLLIGEDEDLIEPLLDRCDTSRIFAFDHVPYLPGESERFFGDDLAVLDDVYGDIVVNEPEDIQVHKIYGTLDLHDVFLSHFTAFCVFDDGNTAVQFVKVEIPIDLHALACLDMVQHKAFGDTSYI